MKACIAKLTKRYDFPDKDRVLKSYTHRIDTLAELAGLKAELLDHMAESEAFLRHWGAVKDWDEKARYRIWTQAQARMLSVAATDPLDGVLPWIMARW